MNLLNYSSESKHHKSRLATRSVCIQDEKFFYTLAQWSSFVKEKKNTSEGKSVLKVNFMCFFFFSFSVSSQTIFFKSLISFKQFYSQELFVPTLEELFMVRDPFSAQVLLLEWIFKRVCWMCRKKLKATNRFNDFVSFYLLRIHFNNSILRRGNIEMFNKK